MCSKKSGSVWLLLAMFILTSSKPVSVDDILTTSFAQKQTTGNCRIFHKASYQIVDTSGFYLYHRYVPFEHTSGKGLIMRHEYYFSKDGNSDIQPLTIENLKRAYPANHRFHYDIDAHFRSDRELLAYDPFTQLYKIKYLYFQSLKG